MRQRKTDMAYRTCIILFWTSLAMISNAAAGDVPKDADKLRKIEVMAENYGKNFPSVPYISIQEAMKLLDSGRVLFIDHRKKSEQAVSMLPQAISSKAFLKSPNKYADRMLIAYCTIGYRSGKLAQRLQGKGFTVLNLRGGILAWIHAGGKVYKDGQSVKRVHVYGKKWDLAPSSYEAVW